MMHIKTTNLINFLQSMAPLCFSLVTLYLHLFSSFFHSFNSCPTKTKKKHDNVNIFTYNKCIIIV